MPYIAIKTYPKDEETKRKLVEDINKVVLDVWGCPQNAISISQESIDPTEWDEKVQKPQVEANKDKMYILNGEKQY